MDVSIPAHEQPLSVYVGKPVERGILPKVVKTVARGRHGKDLDEESVIEVLEDLE